MFKIVFIDVDNTLLDFNECSKAAMKQCFLEAKLAYSEDMFPVFITTNNALWRALERGELTKTRLREIRWDTILNKLGLSYDGKVLEARFEELLTESHIPVSGALDTLKYLAERYDVYAVTNGFSSTQKNRLMLAGMQQYVKASFVSEAIGYDKPSASFFDACLRRIGNPPKEDIILIGDSLTADIGGGMAYGLCCCWYNHNAEPVPDDLSVDYIISDIRELKSIL